MKYNRPTKSNDTVVTLKSSEIGEIFDFQYENGKTYISLNLYNEIPHELICVSHIKKVQSKNLVLTVPIESIHQKLVYMQIVDCVYVVRLPNTFEIQ